MSLPDGRESLRNCGFPGAGRTAALRMCPVLKVQLIQNVLNMFHQLGALFNQNMGSGAFERMNVARNGEHLPILLGCQACGNQ